MQVGCKKQNMMRFRFKLRFVILLVLASILPVSVADSVSAAPKSIDFAQFGTDFYCVGLTVGGGNLFNTTTDTCDPDGTLNLFSYSVCMFENIIDDIMGNLYCGMIYALEWPFMIMLVLFTAVFGAAILTGIVPLNAAQASVFIFKFALVSVFVLDSSMTISILYQGLMGFVQQSVTIILEAFGLTVSGDDTATSILRMMDGLLAQFISANTVGVGDTANVCSYQMVALFTTLVVAVPGISALILATALQFLMVFFKTIIGYLVAIAGIMFLMTLAPLFLSFALFKTTQEFFVQWLQSLISFAIQIFVVFAMIGVVMSLNIGEQLDNLYQIATPDTQVVDKYPIRYFYENKCTICQGHVEQRGPDMIFVCDLDADGNKVPVKPQSLTETPGFMTFVMLTLGKIFFLAFVAETGLGAAPAIARALAGSPYALAIANPAATKENIEYSKENELRTLNSANPKTGGMEGGGLIRGRSKLADLKNPNFPS